MELDAKRSSQLRSRPPDPPRRYISSRSLPSQVPRRSISCIIANDAVPLLFPVQGRYQKSRPQSTRPVKLSLDSDRVLQTIASHLLVDRKVGTVAALTVVSRQAFEAVVSMLYKHVTIPSTKSLSDFTRTLTTARAKTVLTLTIAPLQGSPGSHIAALSRLLSLLPALETLVEFWPSEDWDVVTRDDYPALDNCQLSSLVSRKGWFEIGALVSILSTQRSLRRLVLGGALVDREWQGAQLRSLADLPTISTLTSIDIAQIIHDDTLVVLLRLCPNLVSLKIGLQSVGSTDDDTSQTSIVEALKTVKSCLRHLTLRTPTRSSAETRGLLDACISFLSLESLTIDERVVEPSTHREHAALASNKVLLALPSRLRELEGFDVVSFGPKDVLLMLSRPDLIPVLDKLKITFVKVEDPNELRQIDRACHDYGIQVAVSVSQNK